MRKFEYHISEFTYGEFYNEAGSSAEQLNQLGQLGWEAVGTAVVGSHIFVLLKRRIDDGATPV